MNRNIFTKQNISSVLVTSIKNPLNPYHTVHYGRIDFRNGTTSAHEEFNGSSFDDVLTQLFNYINNLQHEN